VNWHTQLRTQGYAHFPGLTQASLALAAREAIDMDLRDNYDSERQLEYDNRSYCPGRRIPHAYFAAVCGELYSVARITLCL